MARYIDADKLLEWAREFYPIDTQFQSGIKNAPTADVEPVRRGKWNRTASDYECSNCGYPMYYITPYCPYCGAKMEGE